MTQPYSTQPAIRRTPLDAEEQARSEVAFSSLIAEHLVTNGRFRVSADTPELVELFQKAARRAGEMLQRPVVSYSNDRYMVITFGQEEHVLGLTDRGADSVQE